MDMCVVERDQEKRVCKIVNKRKKNYKKKSKFYNYYIKIKKRRGEKR